MAEELTLLERIARSKAKFDAWPEDIKRVAILEANVSADYWQRIWSIDSAIQQRSAAWGD